MSTKDFKVVPFDVDDTLIMHGADPNHPDSLVINNQLDKSTSVGIYVMSHKKHIEFLKNLKVSNFYIIVWSQRGYAWAHTVVTLLGLNQFVDQILTKPSFYVDDKPAHEWMEQYYSKE